MFFFIPTYMNWPETAMITSWVELNLTRVSLIIVRPWFVDHDWMVNPDLDVIAKLWLIDYNNKVEL